MECKLLFVLFVAFCGVAAADSGEETENLEYPCESLDDWDCIRDFLASTSQCEKTSHEDGEPVETGPQYSYAPKLNVTVVCKENKVTFFEPKILDFYINKDTNNLIMTMDFESITLNSEHTIFMIDRLRKEPLVIEEFLNITYSPTITAVIALSDTIAKDDIRAAAFQKNRFPRIVLGPKVTQSSNALVQRALFGLLADLPTAIEEFWLTKAYFFTSVFVNNFLCDFGFEYDGRINRQ